MTNNNPLSNIVKDVFEFIFKTYKLNLVDQKDRVIANNSPFVHNRTNFVSKRTIYTANNEEEDVFFVLIYEKDNIEEIITSFTLRIIDERSIITPTKFEAEILLFIRILNKTIADYIGVYNQIHKKERHPTK